MYISNKGVMESSNFIIMLFLKQIEYCLTEMVFFLIFVVNLMLLIYSKKLSYFN